MGLSVKNKDRFTGRYGNVFVYCILKDIGPISAAVIYAEYGAISNFSNHGQMLAFAGIDDAIKGGSLV